MIMNKGPVVLIILDGWGEAPVKKGNPLFSASIPFWKYLKKNFPSTTLLASGTAVGLPVGQAGNSEAGHINLGAGRVVDQDSVIISKSISSGTFFKNPAFVGAFQHVKRRKSNLHLIGLLSGHQSPHMDPDHLLALITLLEKLGLPKLWLHLFTDGRDSFYYRGIDFLERLLKNHGSYVEIVTVIGRLYLDRKKNWQRTKSAYDAMVLGKGLKFTDAREAITKGYARGETDEFISPSVIVDKAGRPKGLIQDNDAVIFFNLRSDRARQLTKVFVQKDYEKRNAKSFRRAKVLKNLYFVAMTDFGPDLEGVITACPSMDVKETLPFCLRDFTQLYIAEGEKFSHMTYFFNGGYSHPIDDEIREMIPSPSVDSYKQTPAMRVPDISRRIIESLDSYNFIAANFASPDMIGHTGDAEAAKKAVHIIDENLAKIAKSLDAKNGTLIITADHGNIEEMIDKRTNEVNTQHANNPVPFIIYGKTFRGRHLRRVDGAKLADVAPTILKLFDVVPSSLMTGRNLLGG